jgi:hypothetical protein
MVRFSSLDGLVASRKTPEVLWDGSKKLFCSLGLASVTEPITGCRFAPRLCFHQADDVNHCPRLCGLGTRQKRLIGIKKIHVYALALYVDEGYSAGTQHWDEELVNRPEVDKIISCIISSSLVSRKKFLNALDERLLPEVRSSDSEATLGKFRGLFDNVSFRKGLNVSFFFRKGSVMTKVDGKELGELHDPAFSRAFLNMYLGADPVSPKAKDAFRQGLELRS